MHVSSPNPTDSTKVAAFVDRWRPGGGSERSNYQLFLAELCALLGVDHPDPASPDNAENRYVFERAITRSQPDGSTSTVFADLYKKGCFILETKQGADAKVEAASPTTLSTSKGSRFPSDDKRQDAASTLKPLADQLANDTEEARTLEQQILQRLVDLNHERAAEEAEGKIRWLRPEYPDPDYQASEDRGQVSGKEPGLAGTEIQPTTDKPITEKLTWPKELRAQVALIRRLSSQTPNPTVETITPLLKGRNTAKRKEQIVAILETLESLGWG